MIEQRLGYRRNRAVGLVVSTVFLVSGPAHAQSAPNYNLPVFQSDLGGIGLLQTPTARMAPVGRISFTLNKTDPYTNYLFYIQPFDWIEAGFRYTSIGNRDYEASGGELDYLDKGVDVKFSLIDERRVVPAVAVGFRDIGGTGLFSGEYLVANKRWYDFDFSLGLGWGYTGSRGDISSPLGFVGDSYEERDFERGDDGGDFNFNRLFTGDAALFGGIQYHTPFDPLTLQIEYDGNDYESEPLGNAQEQDSPINIGARYALNDNIVLSAGWERGNTAMLGTTIQLNLATFSQVKNDPPPVIPKPRPDKTSADMEQVAEDLAQNAGISTLRMSKAEGVVTITGRSGRYRDYGEAELRGNRILHNAFDDSVNEFRYRWMEAGMAMREDRLPREPLPTIPNLYPPDSEFADLDYRRELWVTDTEIRQPAQGETLYDSNGGRFSWYLTPGLGQFFGGPDGYLYKVRADLGGQFKTDAHGWLSGRLGYTVFDNADDYDTDTESELPRVRTYTGNYFRETTLGVYNLQYSRTARLGQNWFGLAYAGLLEQQYGGAGGEVLWRPFNSRLALGVDANWVRQRAFDTRFEFRDYTTWTGHATAYMDTGIKGVLAKISAGRYLAKDLGMTVDLSREFDSGVRIGAFATITDAGDKFGEGSFDKGLYLSMPLDLFFTQSSRRHASVAWRPITRDGGAKLGRAYSLYGITDARSLDDYWDGFKRDDARD
jgi:hypothetical protein